MSSTNRGYNRHKTDFYVTPQWCIKDFLDAWLGDLQKENPDTLIVSSPDKVLWLDPCAGGDENHEMAYPTVLKNSFGVDIKTIDLRNDSKAEVSADYITHNLSYSPDVIITNPPFHCAKEIIEKSLSDVKMGGYVVMLLRLNFFGSKARKEFLQCNMPKWAYVHNRRMSFTDDKKTDSIEYMHAVWEKGHTPYFTNLKII